jgi:hypothetical protein
MNQIQKYVEQIVEVCKTQRLRKHVEKIFVLSQTINAAASELEAENAALKERLEEARELNDDATLIITKDEKVLRVLAEGLYKEQERNYSIDVIKHDGIEKEIQKIIAYAKQEVAK